MKLLEVILSNDPKIMTRAVLPNEEKISDKNRKPFKVMKLSFIKVKVMNNEVEEEYIITAKKYYTYDGASIPFGIGKGDMRLLIPALFHDVMCERKEVINRERNLSSQIFRELLIQCGVNKFKAQIMYLAVDNYQRFMRGWK